MLERIKITLSNLMPASLGARIAIGIVVGSIGSSTVLGFLSELGAINYALAYGARLPTEGVPFLRYATTGLSLAIFFIAFSILFLLNFILLASIRQFLVWRSIEPLVKDGSLSSMPIARYIWLGVIPALAATQGMFQLFVVATRNTPVEQWVYPAIVFAATVVILVLARKPNLTKWLILTVFVLSMLAFITIAFTPVLYGRALLFARQGGGVEVELQINCHEKNPCEPMIQGGLLLRTTDYFVLRDPKNQKITEIPSKSVENVKYFGEERWGTQF